MKGVLVIVNGAHYFDGCRLDYETEGFCKWRREYAEGTYDGDVGLRVDEETNGKHGASVDEKKGQATVDTRAVGQDIV